MSAGHAGPKGPDAIHAEGLAQGRILIQRCACGTHLFIPRLVCTHCGGMDLAWVEVGGGATLYSYTVIPRKAERGGDYNVSLVDLDEGPRLMSRVVGDRLAIGMRLRARVAAGDGRHFIEFVPQGLS